MNEEDLAKAHWHMGPGILYRHSPSINRRRRMVRITLTADIEGEKFMIRQYDGGRVTREIHLRDLAQAVLLGEEWLP